MKRSKQQIARLKSLLQIHTPGALRKRALVQEDPALKPLMEFILTETPLAEEAIEWLAQLALLYGVPFNNLAADESMLKNPKSQTPNRLQEISALRFFYIDMNWLNSMLDGALSIGAHNSKDFRVQQALHKAYRPLIEQAILDQRLKLRNKPILPKPAPEKMGTLSGLLFRSPVVAQWPGLEILGYLSADSGEKDPGQILDILRMDRLAPDIMLIIFKGVPGKVIVKEPSEGVYAGFERTIKEEGDAAYQIILRQLHEDKVGKPFVDGRQEPVSYKLKNETDFRDFDRRILNVNELKQSLLREIQARRPKQTALSPRDMGIEFINSPRYYIFKPAKKNRDNESKT